MSIYNGTKVTHTANSSNFTLHCDSYSSTERMLRGINCKEKFDNHRKRRSNNISEEMIAANEKTFSSHDRKMKRIIPKHNESSWNTLERSHAEGERKKDETSLSHRHHKNFLSYIHITERIFSSSHDTLVWTLASFLMICTNHDKDGKETVYSYVTRWYVWDVR